MSIMNRIYVDSKTARLFVYIHLFTCLGSAANQQRQMPKFNKLMFLPWQKGLWQQTLSLLSQTLPPQSIKTYR